MHVAQLAVSSFMSLDMPGQNKLSFAFRRQALFRSHVSLVYYLQRLWAEPTRNHEAVSLKNEAIFNAQILSEIPKLP